LRSLLINTISIFSTIFFFICQLKGGETLLQGHIICLYDPIELNKHNFIITTIIISNIKIVIFPGCQATSDKKYIGTYDFFAWKYRINLRYNSPKIHGLRLPCSNASPPFYWQMKKNSRKNAGFLIMVFISKDRKQLLSK
jgi:hypothetical protein